MFQNKIKIKKIGLRKDVIFIHKEKVENYTLYIKT